MLKIIMRGVGENLLQSIVANDGSQHVMAIDQLLPSGTQPAAVNTGQVHFDVDVAANVAQFETVGVPEPIGLLHVGQGEWLVTGCRIRYDDRGRPFGFGGDPLPGPAVFVDDFAHAPLSPGLLASARCPSHGQSLAFFPALSAVAMASRE